MLTLMAVCHILLLALSATPDVATSGQAAVFGYEETSWLGPLACTGKSAAARTTGLCASDVAVRNAAGHAKYVHAATGDLPRARPWTVWRSLSGGRFVIKRNAAQRGTCAASLTYPHRWLSPGNAAKRCQRETGLFEGEVVEGRERAVPKAARCLASNGED